MAAGSIEKGRADTNTAATGGGALRCLLAMGWLALALWLARSATARGDLWLAALATLAVAAPVLLSALYLHTVRLTHRAMLFGQRGLLRRLATQRLLSTLYWSLWSLAAGGVSVFWLASLTAVELALLFAGAPLFALLAAAAARWTQREMAPFAARASALRIARLLLATTLTAAYLGIALAAEPTGPPQPLAGLFRSIAAKALDPDASFLVQLGSRAMDYVASARGYLLAQAGAQPTLQVLALLAGSFALCFNIGLLLSGWMIPAVEYRRILAPLDPSPLPAPVPPARAALTAAIVTLSLLLLLPLLTGLEQRLRQRLDGAAALPGGEQALAAYAEKIDDRLYEAGTLAAIGEARLALLGGQQEALAAVRRQAVLAFARMRDNVDPYLDRYYSLPAEYLRVVGAASGDLRERLRADLNAALTAGAAVDDLEAALMAATRAYPDLAAAFALHRDAILARRRLEAGAGEPRILATTTLAELGAPPESAVLVDLRTRLALSGAGGVGAAVAAKVSGKAAAKGGLALATKALGKVAAGKALGWAGGATAGATVGSVLPGIGTVGGAVLGAGAGLALGISADALLLSLDEAYSREAFRAALIAAIDEQEREFLARLDR